MVICEGFSLEESDLFLSCKRMSSFLCAPFLIAVSSLWGQHGDKPGAVSQGLIVPFLHWKVFEKCEEAEVEKCSSDFQTVKSGLLCVLASTRGSLSSLTSRVLRELQAVKLP